MTSNTLSVVMYHYVRDLKNSRYPAIKGLDKADFIRQIDYLQSNYQIVTMEDVINATHQGGTLPKNAALLTFDDGYVDHFETVVPILDSRGLRGSFFAPVRAITEHCVLDVNKIHFILASSPNVERLLGVIKSMLDKYRVQYNLKSYDEYYAKLAFDGRFDGKDIIFIKRLLQVELPLEVRQLMVDELFCEIVAADQAEFAGELYMNIDQISAMQRAGHTIGSHSYDHFWLGSLSKSEQQIQINRSIEFIKSIGGDTKNWTMCYPYGDYDQNTLSLLSDCGCKVGFTTVVGIAQIGVDNPLTLPRLDTNDLPK